MATQILSTWYFNQPMVNRRDVHMEWIYEDFAKK